METAGFTETLVANYDAARGHSADDHILNVAALRTRYIFAEKCLLTRSGTDRIFVLH